MGNFIASLLSSVDGFDANDQFTPTAEDHQVFNDLLARTNGVVFDPDAYALLVPAWDVLDLEDPTVNPAEREFGQIFRTRRRYVVGESLGQEDPLASLFNGDPIPALRDLKAAEGDLMIAAGADLLATLFDHNLIDEVEILMLPIVLGIGTRQIGELARSQSLALIEARSLPTSAVLLRYRVERPQS